LARYLKAHDADFRAAFKKLDAQWGKLDGRSEEMRRAGYVRVRVDGTIYDLNDDIELDKQKKHTIEVVVDRLVIRRRARNTYEEQRALRKVAERPALYDVNAPQNSEDGASAMNSVDSAGTNDVPIDDMPEGEDLDLSFRQRVADSLETTLKLGNGVVLVSIIDGEEILFSEKLACVYDGISLPEIAPRTFSFNSPHGACPTCTGLGTQKELDAELVVTHPELSLNQGAIAPWSKVINGSLWHSAILEALAKKFNFSLDTPWNLLSAEQQKKVLYGTSEPLTIRYTPQHGGTRSYTIHFEGVIPNLDRRYKQTDSEGIREEIESYMSARVCPDCHGARLKPEALAVTLGGHNIVQVSRLSIVNAQRFFQELEAEQVVRSGQDGQAGQLPGNVRLLNGKNGSGKKRQDGEGSLLGDPLTPIDTNGPMVDVTLTERERFIARQVLKEIRARLQFLVDVGLDYLTIDRAAASLSGGEAQRIRLATQIGSGLMGVLYILDEPSIGLHQRDNARLLTSLKGLRDLGNSVLVVEHDEEAILSADHVIDMGPAAGIHGGHVVAEGYWSPYHADAPHSLFSLSKSFTSTAAGLAVADGRLAVDATVVSFFPDDLPSKVSDNLAAMRVRHLLSMSTGHDKDATGPMTSAGDGSWVKAFLALPGYPAGVQTTTQRAMNEVQPYRTASNFRGPELLRIIEPTMEMLILNKAKPDSAWLAKLGQDENAAVAGKALSKADFKAAIRQKLAQTAAK